MTTAFTSVQTAAVASAVLISGTAAFQAALALGLPLGEAVFGGAAPSEQGVLSGPFRALAAAQAVLLLMMSWVMMARTDVLPIPFLGGGVIVWGTWTMVALLALNTVANLAAPHPVERWVMGSITFALTGLGFAIALRAPVPA